MIAACPPLGWNSWNTFGDKISDSLIREMADIMVDRGYLDAGYEYLVIDDCWSLRDRDENGRLVPDPAKFPNGMKALRKYICVDYFDMQELVNLIENLSLVQRSEAIIYINNLKNKNE